MSDEMITMVISDRSDYKAGLDDGYYGKRIDSTLADSYWYQKGWRKGRSMRLNAGPKG